MTRTMKNTLKSVLVLFIIAAVSVALLSVANRFIKAELKLDLKTATLINQIAPTGYGDQEALDGKHIKMIDLTNGEYAIKDLEKYNKANKSDVIALYTSTNKEGKTTRIVEARGEGFESGKIIMLVAYDDENKITGVITKFQTQSYWDTLQIETLYPKFIGKSGTIAAGSIAANTGATFTLNGVVQAVNMANAFASSL